MALAAKSALRASSVVCVSLWLTVVISDGRHRATYLTNTPASPYCASIVSTCAMLVALVGAVKALVAR